VVEYTVPLVEALVEMEVVVMVEIVLAIQLLEHNPLVVVEEETLANRVVPVSL
jgi:hypothetical protein